MLFLGHVRTHARIPKLVLFYLSAYLSAARSVTFHIQKQIVPNIEDGEATYYRLRDRFLTNDASKFFVQLRNRSEKEMYLPLSFEMMECHPNEETGEVIWTVRASAQPSTPTKRHFGWLEDVLNTEWTSYTQPRWLIEDFPGGKAELVGVCEEYLKSLQRFVEKFRLAVDP